MSPRKSIGREVRKSNAPGLKRKIGEELRKAREEADLSQSELAKRLTTREGKPLDRHKVSQFERGEHLPEPRMRRQLAKALRRDESDLFSALAEGTDKDAVVSRLEKVERRLAAVEKILQGRGIDLVLGSDEEDAAAAAQAAREADLRDQGSGKPARRSRGTRPSKGRRR